MEIGQIQKFEEKVQKTETCWLWKGSTIPNSYVRIYWDKKTQYAHRVSYTVYKGKIPNGLVIDHLCRVRHCVNPEHLEAVTQRENVRRGEPKKITKTRIRILNGLCKYGHKLDKKNAYIAEQPTGNYLKCRECCRMYSRNKVLHINGR